MLITILTAGSRGDTQPYIALGVALKKAGHTARIATFENYGTFVKSYGLEFYPIKGDVTQVISGDVAQDAMKADNPLKLVLSFNRLKSLAYDLQKDFFNACPGSDAIVYHPGAPIGYFAAQHLKIPSILAAPFPMAATREYPALIFYDTILSGRRINRLTHKIFEQVMWLASGSPVKEFWKKEFGHAPENFGCPYPKQITRTLPTIISCSNYVLPRPKDWPEYVYNTGYWFLEDEADWEPPADLLDFLQQGAPPIYVGFGSIGDPSLAAQTTELVIKALKSSGQRGVLATGWVGMAKVERIPEGIFILESAPHTWLFPRMAAVIHHGGAGTTAAGLRAGVPGIIIPSGNDQFAWGRLVHKLGVGARPIPRKDLTAEKLSTAIEFALAPEIKAAAAELGVKIRSETGAETAAQAIMNCLAQPGRLKTG
jgi:sterol 3beta-glucosyltransferase